MQAVLKFNMPEDQDEFRMAIDGWKWRSIVEEMDNYLRGQVKHGDLPDEIHDKVSEIRDRLFQIKNEFDPWEN